MPVPAHLCRQPEAEKEDYGQGGQPVWGDAFVVDFDLKAILWRTDGHALQATDALGAAHSRLAADRNRGRADPFAFFATEAGLVVAFDLNGAGSGEQTKQGSIWAEIPAPGVAEEKREGQQTEHDAPRQSAGADEEVEHLDVDNQVVFRAQEGFDGR